MKSSRETGSIRTQFLRRLVLYESAGFFLTLVLIWIDELAEVRTRGIAHAAAEGALESVIIVVLAVLVTSSTLRAARRIAYLEAFLVMCSWCRRIRVDDQWMSFEGYMQKYGTETSHGMCPDCDEKFFDLTRDVGRTAGVPSTNGVQLRAPHPAPPPPATRTLPPGSTAAA